MTRTLELVSRNCVEYRHRCPNQSISGRLARDIVFDLHVSIERVGMRKICEAPERNRRKGLLTILSDSASEVVTSAAVFRCRLHHLNLSLT
jgi:hypothetical protein